MTDHEKSPPSTALFRRIPRNTWFTLNRGEHFEGDLEKLLSNLRTWGSRHNYGITAVRNKENPDNAVSVRVSTRPKK